MSLFTAKMIVQHVGIKLKARRFVIFAQYSVAAVRRSIKLVCSVYM